MIYFTADLHHAHDREFIYAQRGFSNIKDHDEAILDYINYLVKPIDILYILGDVSWIDPGKFLSRIKSNHIIVIKGNHDKVLYSGKSYVPQGVQLMGPTLDVNISGQKITLSHFPMVSWEASHHGSWNLHGHVHLKELPIKGKQFDVAPSKTHIAPYSFEEIVEIMKIKPDNWDTIKK